MSLTYRLSHVLSPPWVSAMPSSSWPPHHTSSPATCNALPPDDHRSGSFPSCCMLGLWITSSKISFLTISFKSSSLATPYHITLLNFHHSSSYFLIFFYSLLSLLSTPWQKPHESRGLVCSLLGHWAAHEDSIKFRGWINQSNKVEIVTS